MANVKYRKLGEEGTNNTEPIEDEDKDILLGSPGINQPYSRCAMALKVTAILIVLGVTSAIIIPYVTSAPLHAQCNIDWDFPNTSCPSVSSKLQSQIKKWTTDENCPKGVGEKCLYKLVSVDDKQLVATHTTPVSHYVDDLTFTFKPTGQICNVTGYSTSKTWYAVLDYGTNYCNLHNLITGSGLDKEKGYKEHTSDKVCTQYSSADCEKY